MSGKLQKMEKKMFREIRINNIIAIEAASIAGGGHY